MPRGSREGVKRAQAARWPHWRERFETHVDRSPGFGPWGDCHRWTGSPRGAPGNQYGVIRIDGVVYGAHRIAWEIHNGRPVPSGLLVLHACDIGYCVNGEHLSVGTHSDNLLDARRKGRVTTSAPTERAHGIDHGNARFTEEEVLWIRAAYATDCWSISSLATELQCGWSTIDKIVKRQTWRHL